MPLDIITDILGLDISQDNLHAVIGYFVGPPCYMSKKNLTLKLILEGCLLS